MKSFSPVGWRSRSSSHLWTCHNDGNYSVSMLLKRCETSDGNKKGHYTNWIFSTAPDSSLPIREARASPQASSDGNSFMKKNGLWSCSNKIKFQPEDPLLLARNIIKHKISTWDDDTLKIQFRQVFGRFRHSLCLSNCQRVWRWRKKFDRAYCRHDYACMDPISQLFLLRSKRLQAQLWVAEQVELSKVL